MSNRRYIEISSAHRNRNQYPNVSDFEVPFAPSRSLNQNSTIKGAYNNNNNLSIIYNQTLDVADPITNGIVDYQWYGNGVYNSGIIVSSTSNTIVISNLTNSISTLISPYLVYVNNILIGSIQSYNNINNTITLNSTITSFNIQPNSYFVIVYSFNNSSPIQFNLIDSSTVQNNSTISSFYVNVNSLSSPYKNILNFYVGYMFMVYLSTNQYAQVGIINSYNPITGGFTFINPLLTNLQTWSAGSSIVIVNPSNCTSSPVTSIYGPYISPPNTLVLPIIDVCGKNILNYDQSYNNYYLISEDLSMSNSNLIYSKVVSYNFNTNTLTLNSSLTGWSTTNNSVYTLRKTIPNQTFTTVNMNNNFITNSNSTGNTLNITSGSLNPNISYNGFPILINGQLPNTIVSTTSTTITLLSTLNGTVPSGTSFTINFLFPVVNNYNQITIQSNCIFLPSTANSTDNYYTGQYIYIYPSQTADNRITPLSNIQGTCFYIQSYIGNGYNACFVLPINPPNYQGSTLYYPSYNSSPVILPAWGTPINIVSFINDNYNPLIYNGSIVSQNETVAYEISLVNLTVPNITLDTGSRPAYYPYFYVELSNVTASSSSSKNIIYSNNPNSNRALFLVPITDISDPLRSPFIKLDAGSMVQTVKFKPNDCLRFSLFLPNGKPFRTVTSDYYNPSLYNPLVQIDALFGIKRL